MSGQRTGKRPVDVIDLTNSDDENQVPNRKQPRLHDSHRRRAEQAILGSSQAPSSTQWAENGDENDVVDLSQDADEGLGWVCLGAVDAKIVGVRYYNGHASVGEHVLVKRDAGNPYDKNAIRIDNVRGNQIGHIPRELASKLAPYLDARAVVLEGTLAGEKGTFDCPILLKVFGPAGSNARADLENKLKSDRIVLKTRSHAAPKTPTRAVAPPKKASMGYTSSQGSSRADSMSQPEPSISDFVAQSERFQPRDIQQLTETWGAPEELLEKMPMADQPKALQSILLPYQRQGLRWMLDKENPVLPAPGTKDIVQLWTPSPVKAGLFTNIATHFSESNPRLAKGGILADDMGLGKTLQVISLIVEGGPGTTLILAPVSVMSNWSQQISTHVRKKHALKVMTYHGSGKRAMTHNDFGEYDVVITTYGTLSAECFARGYKTPIKLPAKQGLFSMNWARVVLDEGHVIRNATTKAAIAVTSLMATAKWVLTGTPIVNTIRDFHSMLKFLRISGGLEQLPIFNAVFTRPVTLGDPDAELLLQTTMRTMCLRRKKDMKFIDLKLPKLEEYIHKIQFRADEREKYDVLQAEAKGIADKLQQQAHGGRRKGGPTYSHVLEILLRLRQVCCHWKLCGDRVANLLSLLEKDEVLVLTKENRLALQALLQMNIEAQEECPICMEVLHDPVITACKHCFGKSCIERSIELQHKCPMCRAEIVNNDCLVVPIAELSDADPEIDVETKSSKTEALMQILAASRRDPHSKVVIFSQWSSFLSIIQAQLIAAGYAFARIDGSMNAKARDASLHALDVDPNCRILLASLAVASVGLNLVAADTVILADSWWAPAIEDQAVDRVHRLGQTRPCTVWRLVMEGSIEEKVLGIQAEKRQLVGKAFREKTNGRKEKTTRMGDVMKLLG